MINQRNRDSRPVFSVAAALVVLSALTLCSCHSMGPHWRNIALSDSRQTAQEPRRSAALDRLLDEAARSALDAEGKGYITPADYFAAVIDARDPYDPQIGILRGDAPVYPASVIKMCYMAASFDWSARGMLKMDGDMRADLKKMIGPSDNAATNRILDRLSHTQSGEKLEGPDWDAFTYKRRAVARYFQELGLPGLYPVQKTFSPPEIPISPRDAQWLGAPAGDHFQNSNSMTAADTAKLLYLIHRGALTSPRACRKMKDLMQRDPETGGLFFSSAIPQGARLFSKEGFTDLEMHDAAIFDYGDNRAVILVVFTVRHGMPKDAPTPKVLPLSAKFVLDRLALPEADR